MSALTITNCKKRYDNGFEALKGIDLRIESGDFFALLGPNGAGKTTLIGIITSLLKPTQGHVEVFGHDLTSQRRLAKQHIGLVPQEFNFNIFMKVEDILLNAAGYYGMSSKAAAARATELLAQLGLTDKRNQAIRTLSGGMKRRVMVARALMHSPKLLILDEPTAGVDVEIRRATWDFLRQLNQQGLTIILTTHYLEEAEQLCNRLAIIDHGDIIQQGPINEMLNQLQRTTLVLSLAEPLKEAPTITDFHCTLSDPQTLSVCFSAKRHLNELFTELDTRNIQVTRLRNQANRLESLFIDLIDAHE